MSDLRKSAERVVLKLPEALRLADELFDGIVFGGVSIELAREAKNELLRLHEENQTLKQCLKQAHDAAVSLSKANIKALEFIERCPAIYKALEGSTGNTPSTRKSRGANMTDVEQKTIEMALEAFEMLDKRGGLGLDVHEYIRTKIEALRQALSKAKEQE